MTSDDLSFIEGVRARVANNASYVPAGMIERLLAIISALSAVADAAEAFLDTCEVSLDEDFEVMTYQYDMHKCDALMSALAEVRDWGKHNPTATTQAHSEEGATE